jgi:predicted amidohydrolase
MMAQRALAVAQTCPLRGDVDANLAEHLRLTARAASAGARVVVFPELSLTGYELDLADQLAFSLDDARLAPLADAAATESITVVAGAPLRLEARLHIAAFILYPDGTRAVYTKQRLGAFGESARRDGRLPPAEATVFQAGDRNPLVRFDGNAAAVAICADIGRASHPQQAAAAGARTYLASMFVIPSEFDAESEKLGRYAAQHRMAVAFANFGSPSGGLAAAGRSAIWSERGERLVALPPSGSGVAIAIETARGWEVEGLLSAATAAAGP